ncbi:MAG: DUF342 domain-containing protein, partial [Candidatus Anammoxibacter sp.]
MPAAEPVDKAKYLLVGISDDKMEALLTVLQFTQDGIDLKVNDVLEILKSKEVSFGISQQAINAAIDTAREKNVTVINEVIAEGMRPINGKDGKIDFLFKRNVKIKPVDADDSNHLDYHNVSVIQTVKEEQPLAKLIPPTEGKPGKDIFGNDVEPTLGISYDLPEGPGTKASDSAPDLLVASVNGNVTYDKDRNVVVVTPGLILENVDFSVGNISYKGPISITGDVKGGFVVEAGGDIEVGGIIQNSIVRSDGNITIIGGFVGTGEGKVEAKGDVTLGFARNQTIVANNIIFVNESVDCFIFAKERVEAKGGRLSIVGGILAAGIQIEVDVLGSRIEVPTEVEIGVDYVELKGLMNIKRKMKETRSDLERLALEIATMEEMENGKGELSKIQLERKGDFLKKDALLKKTLTDLGVKESIASKKVKVNKDADLIVHHIVYPGVVIKMGGVEYAVQEELSNVRFSLDVNTIKVT